MKPTPSRTLHHRILTTGVAALLASLWSTEAQSQSLLYTYTFDTVSTGSGTTTPGGEANNVTFGSFSAIGTPPNPNATARFSFTDWSTGATNASNTFTGVIDLAQYFEVTLTPLAGFTLNLDNIAFTLQRSGTGIRQYSVRSSLDSYATNLSASISTANANLSVVNTPESNIFQVTDTVTTAQNGSLATLGSLFDALTSAVTFRFYGWNAEASTGTFSLDNVAFTGLVTSSFPTLYWDTNGATPGIGGSGQWDSAPANTNWNPAEDGQGAPQAFTAGSPAVFGGTAGVVEIAAGGVIATGGLTFSTESYTIAGGTLTLNGNGRVNTAHPAETSTTISAQVSGDAGLTKEGTGTLMLTGTNDFDGVVNINAGALAIADATNLGKDTNGVSFGGGKLIVGGNVALIAGQDLSGAGVFEISAGQTLSTLGNVVLSSLTLGGSGTLAVNGATRTVGAITFTDTATLVSSGGTITATTITSTQLAGTAAITSALDLGATTRAINVTDGAAEVDLALEGDLTITGTSSTRLHKLGAGTLRLAGNNAGLGGSARIGTAGSLPAPGGTVIITNKNALGSDPTLQIQFNDGILRATTPLTGPNAIPLGLSIGAGQGVPATFTGEAMEFAGVVNFFRAGGTAYTHAIRVENTTTFTGNFTASQGAGFSSGFNLTGNGTLVLAGASNDVAEPIVVDGPTLAVHGALTATAATVEVKEGALTGGGSIAGNTLLEDGAFLAPGNGVGPLTFGGDLDVSGAIATSSGALKFELGTVAASDSVLLPAGQLTLGAGLAFSDFDFTTTPDFGEGTYILFATTLAITDPVGPLVGLVGGLPSTIELSPDGTDILLNVVPEPGSAALLLGGLGLMAAQRRRRA